MFNINTLSPRQSSHPGKPNQSHKSVNIVLRLTNSVMYTCKIMNSTKGVKSGVPKRVSISCLTCGTRHDSRINISYASVGEQNLQHIRWHRSAKSVNKACMTTIKFPNQQVMMNDEWFSNTSDFPPCREQLWDKSISHGFHDLQFCAYI